MGGHSVNDIVVDPGCFLGLCAASIEAYNRERLNRRARQGERRQDWFGLVGAIRRRTYARRHEVAWTFRRYPRKLGATIAIKPQLGYDVTLAGYRVVVEPNGGGALHVGG